MKKPKQVYPLAKISFARLKGSQMLSVKGGGDDDPPPQPPSEPVPFPPPPPK